MEMEMAMFNDILQSGDMPAILRDVIITVLYKGKGLRDKCDSYRGISLTTEFEKRCALHSMEETILGVNVQFDLADGFIDDTKIRRHRSGMRTATVVDVLYADDCVLFTNTIGAMQLMIVQFDEVSILFGMELAISKTKIVCNQ